MFSMTVHVDSSTVTTLSESKTTEAKIDGSSTLIIDEVTHNSVSMSWDPYEVAEGSTVR